LASKSINQITSLPEMASELLLRGPAPNSVSSTSRTDPASNSGPPGGLVDPYSRLLDLLLFPTLYANHFAALNLEAPKSVLLYGPPGVGKTLLVRTVAKDSEARLVVVNGAEIASPHVGEAEGALDKIFAEAADGEGVGIVFIDELDALAPLRERASASTLRLLAHLVHALDSLRTRKELNNVVVIAATNRPGSIDPSLRRSGRFDREIGIDPPGVTARTDILQGLLKNSGVTVAADVELARIADGTPGFVGADLENLVREACGTALRRSMGTAEVRMDDFVAALKTVGPSSATRGWTVDVGTKRGWDSVGGLESVKRKLRQAVEWPVLHRETFERLGLKPPRGVLLYGPPGCSKTTLAKIVAGTAGLNFASLDVAGLFSSYVGDSERLIREAFSKARATTPCVLFLDEVDALAGSRESGGSSSDTVQGKILSSLLNEMDGIESAEGILVIGATNRPWAIDSALMRPGRFDRLVYVPPPDLEGRKKVLEIYTKDMPMKDVDLGLVATELTGDLWSGADVENLCREAALGALRRTMRSGEEDAMVRWEDFEAANRMVKPSLSPEQVARYERFESGRSLG